MSQSGSADSGARHVAIVDDDGAVLRSLTRMLGACGFAVTAFSSARDFFESLADGEPDVLLVDLRMPGGDGMSLFDELRDRGYRIPAVFLSGHADIPTSVKAIRSGAIDFLEKPCDEQTLLRSLARAFDVAARNHRPSDVAELLTRWRRLTPREREVCRHVVQGELNKQIAAALGTTEKTVKVHRARGMQKMGAKSVAELVRMIDRVGGGEPDAALPAITPPPGDFSAGNSWPATPA